MNKITFSDFVFTDADILTAEIYTSNSPVSESLEADSFIFTILSNDGDIFKTADLEFFLTVDGEQLKTKGSPLNNTLFGTPVLFYRGNTLDGKFFLKNITRLNRTLYKVECTSAVGLLSYIEHYGGVYGVTGTTYVTDLIEDIIGDVGFDIDSVFNTMPIQGYLPKASARDNLQQVLFAVGGAITKQANGTPLIKFNQPEEATTLTNSQIYVGAKFETLTKATKVTLVEHSYFKGLTTTAEELFDNIDTYTEANNQEIVFNQPYYDYIAYDEDGVDITSHFILDSGVNFVKVGTTGYTKGRVVGKPYIHAQRQLIKDNLVPEALENNEISVTNATLVSPYNSGNCLERLASYYSTANAIKMDFVFNGEKTGNLIQFPDFYTNANRVTYIKSLTLALSNTIKAQSQLATDWIPNHLGNTYNKYVIVDRTKLGGLSANWEPQDAEGNSLVGKECYVVMFSAASGGQGGYNGASGGRAGGGNNLVYPYDDTAYNQYNPFGAGYNGLGGAGGNGGNGGQPCKRYNTAILTMASSYLITLGEGGNGGSGNGGSGSTGGHTTFGSYSSDTYDLNGAYVNIIDGSSYCNVGATGTAGGKGGDGGLASELTTVPAVFTPAQNGGNVGDHTGGTASIGRGITEHNQQSNPVYWSINGAGGGGGGASVDANGSNATSPDTSISSGWREQYNGIMLIRTIAGGTGGNGANATSIPSQSSLGNGGTGGNGGGGGGGGGASAAWGTAPSGESFGGDFALDPYGGTGGTGSAGGKGSDGFIIVYYSEE